MSQGHFLSPFLFNILLESPFRGKKKEKLINVTKMRKKKNMLDFEGW